MADHVWREMGRHEPLWNEVKMLERDERWRVRRLIESAHMLSYEDLLSKPNIEINTM